jgi:hypothetical protein
MNSVNQTGNQAHGDIVAGDKITTSSRRTPITELNERYIAASGDEEGLDGFIESLQHYWDRATNGDIRPLSQKLTEADRIDAIDAGEALKEQATKIILRFQTSRAAQELLAHVLAELYGRFMFEVKPSIQAGADRVTTDGLISEKVIGATLNDLENNVLGLKRTDLIGLVYFLTGNCHIRWDKC